MFRHLFLTGEKQVGKSTLIRRLLATCPEPYGGFFTTRLRSEEDGRMYVHLIRPGELPCKDNILFCCNDPGRMDSAVRFDDLGCAALQEAKGFRLIVMDELGPHEEEAHSFRHLVLSLLDSDVHVLGVLQKAPGAFLQKIAEHPDVQVVTVTEENRDALADQLLPFFNDLF